MASRALTALITVSLLAMPAAPRVAHAENQMGYQLLSAQEARTLPHNRGALGMDVERAQYITDDGMTFELIRVKQVRRGSAGALSGFHSGDLIIAVNGRVFASLAAFGGYIQSILPGERISVDYIPAGGGPEKAERVNVIVAAAGQPVPQSSPSRQQEDAAAGMSTRTKIGSPPWPCSAATNWAASTAGNRPLRSRIPTECTEDAGGLFRRSLHRLTQGVATLSGVRWEPSFAGG